jgi:hypothetical protein
VDNTEYTDLSVFKEWDQGPEDEKEIDEIISMYEHGFAGSYCSEETAEELRASVEIPYGSDVARIYNFENIGAKQLITPFTQVMQAYPNAWPGPAQTRGSCVADASMRTALGTLVAEVFFSTPDEVSGKLEECPKVSPEAEKSAVLSFETLYWYRGHGGDGWDCGSAAKVITKESGAVLRRNYPELGVDLTAYSGKLAGKYGRQKPPKEITDHLDNNLFRTATQLQSFEEVRDFLAKGFYVLTCGSQGFSSKRDENGVSGRQGSWAHALGLIGADDRNEIIRIYKEPLVLVLNTWGKSWNGGPRRILGTDIDIPLGSFWCRWSEFKNRYMVALSGLNGWERKEEFIDWTTIRHG